MFDLGYKQIVINSESVVKVVGAETVIEGFGKFETGKGENKWSVAAEDAAVGKYDVTVPPGAAIAGSVYNIKVYFKGAPRILSELFSGGGNNYGDVGEIKVFQSQRLLAVDTLGTAMVGDATATPPVPGAIIDAFNDLILKFTGAGPDFSVEFVEGYEGVGIAKISMTNADDQDNKETFLVTTETQAPSEGIGLGKQIETDVRNAVWDNIDPYGIQFGGNTAVDVRAKYKTIYFEMPSTPATSTKGWEPHAARGYGDAQTEATYGNVKYVAFVNEASAVAAAGLIEAI